MGSRGAYNRHVSKNTSIRDTMRNTLPAVMDPIARGHE